MLKTHGSMRPDVPLEDAEFVLEEESTDWILVRINSDQEHEYIGKVLASGCVVYNPDVGLVRFGEGILYENSTVFKYEPGKGFDYVGKL